MVPFVALFCQPPDWDQGVAAAASTGCECGIAHLLRLAHHCQQRVCIGLLIAGEQRLGGLPATRRGDVLEGVMLSLCRPLPAIRCQSPPSSFGSLAFLSATCSHLSKRNRSRRSSTTRPRSPKSSSRRGSTRSRCLQ